MITTVPSDVLTTPAKSITKIDKRIKDVIARMKRELINTKNPRGVGLAAPQISESLRLFITRPTPSSAIRVFCNPEILWHADDLVDIDRPTTETKRKNDDKKLEGCLSIPNVWGNLKRPSRVTLRFMDEAGGTKEETFSGFMATIVQHETDHVNGVLFTQRVLEQKEKLYRIETDNGEEQLVEIKL